MQLLPEVAGSYYAGELSNPPAAPIMNGMTQGPAEFMEDKEQVRAGMDEAYNSYLTPSRKYSKIYGMVCLLRLAHH
jgi:hypothetical protein